MARITRFTELEAWKRGHELMVLCEEFLGRSQISFEKRFREQLTDASSSVPRNVAEGFGRFRPKENAQYVRVAKGSANEVLDLFIEAHTKGHLGDAEFPRFETAANRAIGTLVGYLRYLENCADRRGRKRSNPPTSKPRNPKPRNPETPNLETPKPRNPKTS